MNTEQAIEIIECFFRESDNKCANGECDFASPMCQYDREAAFEIALSALREKAERENPKPLTLEQLKERVGKPVWIQKEHYGEYKVFKKHHDSLNKYGKRYWFADKEILFECHYGETWLAYDHEPKGAHK